MTDHTEREREARMAVAFWGPDPWDAKVAHRRDNFDCDLDAYRAAVRLAVLAEVAAEVAALQTYLLSAEMPWDEVLVERKYVFAALTALEATDADA